jgi:hypothetical protein
VLGVQIPLGALNFMKPSQQSYLISRFVILLSILIAVIMGTAIWDINPWPTDAEVYYMPAALRIPYVHYLSDIHTTEGMENIRWLHGKEFYVAAISLFQFLLNDFESLRPLMLIGLISIALSAIFLFYLCRRFWGEWVALLCFLSFTFCLWPYIYILFAKHQTLGLMFFLASLLLVFNFNRTRFPFAWPFLSGFTFGLALYSSTTSSLFVPFYVVAFLIAVWPYTNPTFLQKVKSVLGSGFLALAGFLLVFFYVNMPDILGNIKNFAEYVHISGAFNHFYYNQPALQQWFPHLNVGEVRGGWIWIVKYLFLILPVMFPLYLVGLVYLLVRAVQEKTWPVRLKFAGIILLSFCPAVMAEMAKVAQYGANYFPMLVGILLVLGFAAHDLYRKLDLKQPLIKKVFLSVLAGIFILHAGFNTYAFVNDVYIPRMATTFLSNKIKELGVERLATYRTHFHRNHFAFCLDSKLREKLGWVAIKSLSQLQQGGYVIVPPATGDSIYVASSTSYNNYDKDIVLVQLLRRNLLKDCAVASYRTLASSRIWQQEEEILSYRGLILGQHFPDDQLGRVWLIDAQKVKKVEAQLMPTAEEMQLLRGDVKNVGTAEKFYIFEGQRVGIQNDTQVHRVIGRVGTKGNPDDSLVLSVFRTDPKDPIWLPAGKNFTSQPLKATEVHNGPQGMSTFSFDPPLELEKGVYTVVVYRTGKPDNKNYYQIDSQRFAVQ